MSLLTPRRARKALGLIRLANGVFALGAPRKFVAVLGGEPDEDGRTLYLARLFGVRTVVLGIQLLLADDDSADYAVKYAVPIHASDAIAAAMSVFDKGMATRAALNATAISSLNTLLAVVASRSAGGVPAG